MRVGDFNRFYIILIHNLTVHIYCEMSVGINSQWDGGAEKFMDADVQAVL
jgi:hypothetical protein